MKYSLDALGEESSPRPDRLVLISPMIGVTTFARFAGAAGLPAILPAFAKAARLARLPPIPTFQSVLDFTVSTSAVVSGLYAHLPSNGSELVLFDLNQAARVSPLPRSPREGGLSGVLPPPPRRSRTTIVANATPTTPEVVARTTEAGGVDERSLPLGASYPADVYSLSHVALPFPDSDSLYGMRPDPSEDSGVNLGALAARGERGGLLVSLDALLRASSSPFFSYMIERIDACLGPPGEVAGRCAS